MDIHLNVWGIKTRLDGENVAIQFREIDTKDKIIGHVSKATALVLYEDLGKLLGKDKPGATAPTKVEHCHSAYCINSDKCQCQCPACLAIVNF